MKKLIFLISIAGCASLPSKQNYIDCTQTCANRYDTCHSECDIARRWCTETGFTEGFCDKKEKDCSNKCDWE